MYQLLLLFLDFIYLREREREREREGAWRRAEGEADFPLNREPNVGLDPWTPGS